MQPTPKQLASNIEGAVDRETVLDVLKSEGVSISLQEGGAQDMLVLAKGEMIDTRRIPVVVRKTILWKLAHKFGFHIARFYNPHKVQ